MRARGSEKSGRFRLFYLLAAIPLVALIVLAVAGVVSQTRYRRVLAEWDATLGTKEQFLERYPSRSANDAALRAEELSAALGIVIAPFWTDRRFSVNEEAADRHSDIKPKIVDYLSLHHERERTGTDPLPEPVEEFLDAYRQEIAAVRNALARGDVPLWELRMEEGLTQPTPNLLGQMSLHQLLLVDALYRSRRGEHDLVAADLEASWRLNAGLREDPVLITQLIALAVARLQLGVLRQVEADHLVWSDRLWVLDFRRSVLTALRFDARQWMDLDPVAFVDNTDFAERVGAALQRPYFRLCTAQISGSFQQRLDRLSELEYWCDRDLDSLGADLASVEIPRWNIIGMVMVLNLLDEAIDRVARFELERELTGHVLAARMSRSPERPRSGVEISPSCPEDRWHLESTDEGVLIRFSRRIDWPEMPGPELPTSYLITEAQP